MPARPSLIKVLLLLYLQHARLMFTSFLQSFHDRLIQLHSYRLHISTRFWRNVGFTDTKKRNGRLTSSPCPCQISLGHVSPCLATNHLSPDPRQQLYSLHQRAYQSGARIKGLGRWWPLGGRNQPRGLVFSLIPAILPLSEVANRCSSPPLECAAWVSFRWRLPH